MYKTVYLIVASFLMAASPIQAEKYNFTFDLNSLGSNERELTKEEKSYIANKVLSNGTIVSQHLELKRDYISIIGYTVIFKERVWGCRSVSRYKGVEITSFDVECVTSENN